MEKFQNQRMVSLLMFVFITVLTLFSTVLLHAQSRTISGRVTDRNGNPLQNVSVSIKGSQGGTVTDVQGKFSLPSDQPKPVLLVSLIGYQNRELTFSGSSENIVLEQNFVSLDTATIYIGYGYQRRADVTAALGVVKGEAIKDLPATNVEEALQGRIAGVNVIKSSGAPGASAAILIRGISSFHNITPLYIVDGVRSSGENFNVNDIATITVLKDASAAAIYGSAAAGGVILITTKKGTRSHPVINFSARYGVTHPIVLPLLGRNQWVGLKQYLDPTYLQGTNVNTLPDVNWVNELYSNGNDQKYDLSISGGNDYSNFMVSGFYDGQKGVYIDNSTYLSGARINSDFNITKAIKVGEQVYATTQNNNPTNANPPPNPPFRTVPIMPVYDTSNTSGGGWGKTPSGFQGGNAVGQELTYKSINKSNNIQANAYAEVKLPAYLTFRATFSYSYNSTTSDNFQETYNFGSVVNSTNFLQKSWATTESFLQNYVLSFDHTFGKHSFNALIGYEQISTTTDGISATYNNQAIQPNFSFFPTSQSEVTPGQPTGAYDPNGLIKSEFARLNYSYDGRYFLSGVIRRDGNVTIFGPDNRYGVFPSISAGWKISEEKFFNSALNIVNELKFRGSYGELGNDNTGKPYYFDVYYQPLGLGNNFSPGGQTYIGYGLPNLANAAIRWETLYETNIGLDALFINSKLSLSMDWYNKTSKNLLYDIPLPPSTGFSNNYTDNIGSVNNKGFEFTIGYHDKAGAFNYSVSFNGAFNTNKILSLDGTQIGQFQDGSTDEGGGYGVTSGQPITMNMAGHSFGEFYGYKSTGLYSSNQQIANSPQFPGQTANLGDLIFSDVNKSGSLSDSDKTFIGNPNPKFVYGVSINLNWKGLDLSLLFNGVAGVDLYNGIKGYSQYLFSDGNTSSRVFGDSYLQSNGLTSQPRMGVFSGGTFNFDPNGNYTRVNSYAVEKAGYLKLQVLQLGYSFSTSALQSLHVTTARIYAQGTNVFTITKYSGLDPELYGTVTAHGIDGPNQYPHTQIFSLGLSLSF